MSGNDPIVFPVQRDGLFGPPPVLILFVTRLRAGLIRLTLPLDSFETQTLPAP